MGFSVRLKGHDSWLDPESAGLLGWKLGKRLAARIAGREGRFITLTYDRSRYADAQDCFDRARAQKHVSRFMRKLSQLLGVNLRGKWLCKLEFQREGWVHWHIVLVDVGKIPRHLFLQLYALWGRGSIDVAPLTEENARYLMKYVAKGGEVPGWVFGYPPRSVKVVRPSAGFWNDDQARIAAERTAARKDAPPGEPGAGEHLPPDMHGLVPPSHYRVPVGAKLRTQRAIITDGKRTFSIKAPHEVLLRSLRTHARHGGTLDGNWRRYEGESSRVLRAVLADCEAASIGRGPEAPEAQPSHDPPYGTPLFLRGTGKRARGWWCIWRRGRWLFLSPEKLHGKLSKWWARNAPWWVKLEWEQDGRSRGPDAALRDAIERKLVFA